jgi:hypothetical protein
LNSEIRRNAVKNEFTVQKPQDYTKNISALIYFLNAKKLRKKIDQLDKWTFKIKPNHDYHSFTTIIKLRG